MRTFIEPLFVNIAIIFAFTHLLNMISPFQTNQDLSLKNKVMYGLLSGIGALACMIYPIETLRESFFDLRNVPILIVSLYAGWVPGIICTVMVIIARLFIGGGVAWLGVVLALVAIITALCYRNFFTERKRKRWQPAIFIAVVYSLFYSMFIYTYLDFLPMQFYVVYFSCFFIAFFSCIFLIERLFSINMQLKETAYLDKLSVAGQMAAAIAHEVRNPLTTVRGLIQFLGKETEDTKLKEFSPLLLDELDRTNKIITDYLTMVKPADARLEVLDINDILSDVKSLISPYGSMHDVDIKLEPIGDFPLIADAQQLKQCLINLIKNGIEAIEGEGVIHIYLYNSTKHDFTFVIEDNGKGMSHEELDQIGLPFYTTKSKGTGLGTMITYRLIQEMYGKLKYESQLGVGTRVLITLPVAEQTDWKGGA
ncbi:ATP-binding protein [Fictibacillus iocasae]|uniref:histidine kinase n=1 Tax=Fictibacillus iocasae TaxID=2715437 RepID=A0ABW2NHB1_9BACL